MASRPRAPKRDIRSTGQSVRVRADAYKLVVDLAARHPLRPSVANLIARGIELAAEEANRLYGKDTTNNG